jgi:hypothetical protein
MQIEMLCDTVSPRLVMIRGCEYTRVKLATVYPSAPIGGHSQRGSKGFGHALESYILDTAQVCMVVHVAWMLTWKNGARATSERNGRSDFEWAL